MDRSLQTSLFLLLLADSLFTVSCAVGGGASQNDENGDGDGDGDANSPWSGGSTGQGASTGSGSTGAGAAGSGASTGNGGGTLGSGGTDGSECIPVVNRCDCVVHADGTSSSIDAFEDGDMRINVIDGRDGEWFQAKGRETSSPLGTMTLDGGALHLSGGPTTLSPPTGEPDDWATFGVPLGQCYDASPYAGIRFRIKSGPSGADVNSAVRFSISTPPTTETAAGGDCPDGDLGCYNHFGRTVTLSSEWQTVTTTWAEMTQSPGWGITAPNGYEKQKNIMAINFAPLENTKSYDFFIDDVAFTSEGGGSCATLISESTFNSLFPSRNSFYTYAGFAEAVAEFPAFCGEGQEADRKRDVAALFAHTIQETGGNVSDPTTGLVHVEEINKNVYCDASRIDFPCAGGKSYFGRGPLQLTWNYNYGTAGQALGLPLLAQPEIVASSSANAFRATLWFWMTRQPIESPHSLMVTGQGFGETIRLVNGPLECDGAAPAKTANRVAAYQHFCSQLGVDPGVNLDCQ